MIIYYDEQGSVIEEPDCNYGWLEYNAECVSEEIVNGIKHKTYTSTKAVFHPFTPEEQAERDAQKAAWESQEAIPDDIMDLQDAVIEVAELSADNETSISDIEDALVELAALIGGEE